MFVRIFISVHISIKNIDIRTGRIFVFTNTWRSSQVSSSDLGENKPERWKVRKHDESKIRLFRRTQIRPGTYLERQRYHSLGMKYEEEKVQRGWVPSGGSFTKSMSLRFDGPGSYTYNSRRPRERSVSREKDRTNRTQETRELVDQDLRVCLHVRHLERMARRQNEEVEVV